MKSVWYEMGMRDGVFCGVIPGKFLDTAYHFFFELGIQCRKGIEPDYTPYPDWQINFSFNGIRKYGEERMWRPFTLEYIYENMFTFRNDLLSGLPVPEEVWNAEKPEWKKVNYTEEELLGEEIIPHPLSASPREARFSITTEWHSQRYRLIQKMRYLLVPLKIYVRRSWYDPAFYEYYGRRGCIDDPGFSWEQFPQIKVQVPEYWTKEGAAYKIGIFAKKVSPSWSDVPFSGCYWLHNKEFTTQKESPPDYWYGGASELRIYGIADLATHPDFSRYFHISSTQNKED